MINKVVKRNGTIVDFNIEKLSKWARYATKQRVSWEELSDLVLERLNNFCTTEEIHQTMIKVCVSKNDINWSRVAARLVYATIRKNMERHIGLHDKFTFETIYNKMTGTGHWVGLPKFNPRWNDWYKELCENYFEYWQVKQWNDKYSLTIEEEAIETPHMACLAIGLAFHGDTELAYKLAKGLVEGKINLPTPCVNGVRNGDFDTISCCLFESDDTVDSIGVAQHIAYKMTAKKAGIGSKFNTRALNEAVKGGAIKHLGKNGIFATLDKGVNMFTQVGRGGSATNTIDAFDLDIEELLLLKTQRIAENKRIDKIDYEFAYNEYFVKCVVNGWEWGLYSTQKTPEVLEKFYTKKYEDFVKNNEPVKTVKALDLLKIFLTSRAETGRVYGHNVTRSNTHTPFIDPIHQSNLCEEIFLPTKGYKDMSDLYATDVSEGETAFCAIAAINAAKTSFEEYEDVARTVLETVEIMIQRAPMMTKSMQESILRRRSVGVGIMGFANFLYDRGLDFDGSKKSLNVTKQLAQLHYESLLKASQEMSKASGIEVEGVDLNWLPVDTMKASDRYRESIVQYRGKPRQHSVLVAHMPTESSSQFSGGYNGLYPARKRVINKQSRQGVVQYIGTDFDFIPAWEIPSEVLSKYYGIFQDWADQGISADYYMTPSQYKGNKIPMSKLIKDFLHHEVAGVKSMYYMNTNDNTGGVFQVEDDTKGCEGGSCTL